MTTKIKYDKATALIVVDVQNDFADPKGSLYVKGGEDVVSLINAEIKAARDAGGIVLFTQDWHPAHTPHFAKDGGIWPDHCVAGTWGAEFYSTLRGWSAVPWRTIRKGINGEDGYSGFTVSDPISGKKTKTDLDRDLRAFEISKLVVVGLATDYCVKATAIDGAEFREKGSARYAVTVLLDAVRAVNIKPGDGASAIAEMRKAGVTLL
jgi:nicotinamidase/pyrazinamidase